MILGIDEVGRGPWAGPLVVGAVVLGNAKIDGLTDSKKLSKKERNRLDIEIREKAAGFGIGWVDASAIDEIGLSKALVMATKQAVEQVNTSYNEIIIDGTVNFLAETTKGKYVTTMKKADLLIPSVSAASIIAKVARDNYMAEQDKIYPGYNFERHVGYGTKLHSEAIEKHGVTKLHRLSFKPLQKYRINQASDSVMLEKKKNTTDIGNAAESEAVKYLKKNGHKIIHRNWKNKYCEIDIVSRKNGTIYFNEVKYRKNDDQGGGLSAISASKLKQMKFAANYYININSVSDEQVMLTGISLSGNPPVVNDFLEIS